MPRCDQKGFTLIELIIVVAIIGIIAAIAIPQFNDYRRKSELASVMSNCRSLFRAFTVYYIENESEYPSNENEFNNPDWDFNPVTFDPLIDPDNLGGIPFEIEINQLKKNIGDSPANRARRDYYSDPSYQQFYLVMTWEKDPTVLIVVASSDNVKDLNGNLIDGGNYLDGVYIWQNGKLRYQ